MRKSSLMLLSAILAVILCGCGASQTQQPEGQTEPEPTPAPIVTAQPTTTPVVTQTEEPTLPIKITQHPANLAVKEGQNASFIAGATDYQSVRWQIVSADDRTSYSMEDAPKYFSGMTVTGDGTQQVVLNNCPLSLNGWFVKAIYSSKNNAQVVETNKAQITVLSAKRQQIWAYPSSGNFMYNNEPIQLNAEDNVTISYQLRYSSDGMIDMGTVKSHDLVYIQARGGHYDIVTLTAYVESDPGNSVTCTYYMDNSSPQYVQDNGSYNPNDYVHDLPTW